MPPRLAGEVRTPLREVLERLGQSQSALARTLNCDRRQVGVWVRGDCAPAPARRVQIANAVGVSAAELWPDVDRDSHLAKVKARTCGCKNPAGHEPNCSEIAALRAREERAAE